ncbi:MAG TPA: nucleotidyltransferase family protein [Rhodanobacteraceae bacterium]|nr:nucleotidyltransferase family protein [Rhodanobacteraceae bacterium]
MKALIFAAGRGERMRPLTEATPKPLLTVRGKPLLAWHLERLAAAGIDEVVINVSHLADQFPRILGDGERFGVRIHWSHEGDEPLETGGGMLQALPLLGEAPFLAVNGDIFTDFDFATLPATPAGLAHLVLVDNPPQHPRGDFVLHSDARVSGEAAGGRPAAQDSAAPAAARSLTYAGIGLFRPEILRDWRTVIGCAAGAAADVPRFKLAPLLYAAAAQGELTGQHHSGCWIDVGTPKRLAQLQATQA